MSRYVATAAHRGATQLVNEFDEMLQAALAEYGPDEPVQFTNTAYHLPVTRAMSTPTGSSAVESGLRCTSTRRFTSARLATCATGVVWLWPTLRAHWAWASE